MRCPTVMRFPSLFHLMLPNNDNFLIALKDSPTILGVFRLTLTVISVFDVVVEFQFFGQICHLKRFYVSGVSKISYTRGWLNT